MADTYTPVGIYLKLRDKFTGSILMESSDYQGGKNSFSFLCADPLATFILQEEKIVENYPDGTQRTTSITEKVQVAEGLREFSELFDIEKPPFKFFSNGLYGYTAYDAVKYFEDVEIKAKRKEEKSIPDMHYSLFRYVIAIDHFKDEIFLFELLGEKEESQLNHLISLISNRSVALFNFSLDGGETSNLTDKEYLSLVTKGKEECKKGNLFQIVLSREFIQKFKGDEFNLYRALRSVNPSPYLFYFDFGSFKIFGSSPEAQLVIKNGEAQIHPIAGTFKRTGDDEADAELSKQLRNDKKEFSEHVMLVDLARNDLSRNCTDVKVEVFAETQYYSHVIHLVSKVTGKLKNLSKNIRVFADTFPAGTLSGAPKVKAMQVVDDCENDSRGYYGGAIGFIGFNGDYNHAIVIRSFLSKNNTLFYRAGAGVVIESKEENELQEVNNKLGALKMALSTAVEI